MSIFREIPALADRLTGGAALGFRLSFVCVGVITLLSAWVFRHLDEVPAPRAAPAVRTAQGTGR